MGGLHSVANIKKNTKWATKWAFLPLRRPFCVSWNYLGLPPQLRRTFSYRHWGFDIHSECGAYADFTVARYVAANLA